MAVVAWLERKDNLIICFQDLEGKNQISEIKDKHIEWNGIIKYKPIIEEGDWTTDTIKLRSKCITISQKLSNASKRKY